MKRWATAVLLVNVLAWAAPCDGGSISGLVRSKTTGEPIPRAAVTLRPVGGATGSPRTTPAGPGGEFHFEGTPPGRYQLVVRKSGFQMGAGAARQFTLGNDEELRGVFAELWPTGSISGVAAGAGGEPLEGALVRAYAIVHEEDGIAARLAGRSETDDTGEFRVFGLEAGRYLLWAEPPRGATPAGHFYANTGGVFYPSTAHPSQALPIDLGWGQRLAGIDLNAAANAGYSVGGVVADAQREGACGGCSVRAVQTDGPWRIALPGISPVSRDGTFVLRGLAAGDYTLLAWRGGSGDTVGKASVTLRDRPIADAGILVGAGQTVSGEIILQEAPEEINTASWKPRLSPVELADAWPTLEGTTRPDSRFEILEVPPADYRFEVLELPAGAYLKELMTGRQALPSPVISVGPASSLVGLRAVVAFDAGAVQGRVESEGRDEAAAGSATVVYLLPENSGRSYARARRLAAAANGRFRFDSVAPGGYRLYALPQGGARRIFDPAVQVSLKSYVTAVEVRPGEVAEANVKRPPTE